MKKLLAAVGLVTTVFATSANAGIIISTLPEFDGDGMNGVASIGTFNFVIPVGESILSVLFESTFGHSIIDTSATGVVLVDGVQVGACAGPGNICWDGPGPTAISFLFAAADFGLFTDNMANLVYDQTDCCFIRFGESTLTITTSSAVPEPASLALLGIGLAGLGAMRKRNIA